MTVRPSLCLTPCASRRASAPRRVRARHISRTKARVPLLASAAQDSGGTATVRRCERSSTRRLRDFVHSTDGALGSRRAQLPSCDSPNIVDTYVDAHLAIFRQPSTEFAQHLSTTTVPERNLRPTSDAAGDAAQRSVPSLAPLPPVPPAPGPPRERGRGRARRRAVGRAGSGRSPHARFRRAISFWLGIRPQESNLHSQRPMPACHASTGDLDCPIGVCAGRSR